MKFLKLSRKEIRQLNKLICTMNNLLDIENTIKIKSTIKQLGMEFKFNEKLKFDYGKDFIRIYSTSDDWNVYHEYEKIYFNFTFIKNNQYVVTSNCKTPSEYIPNIIKTRLEKGLRYLAQNSKDFIRKINLIVDEDKRNVALKEFFSK